MFPFYIPENIRNPSFLYPLKTSENLWFAGGIDMRSSLMFSGI